MIADVLPHMARRQFPAPEGKVAPQMPAEQAPEHVEKQREGEDRRGAQVPVPRHRQVIMRGQGDPASEPLQPQPGMVVIRPILPPIEPGMRVEDAQPAGEQHRSEEHTSELQSLMRNSYAVFCLKKKTTIN